MKPSLESILYEAVNFEARAFDDDQDINGADLVEWFAQWQRRARPIVRTRRPTLSGARDDHGLGPQLIGALQALQLMLAREDADMDLACALDNGGIQVTSGEFRLTVFKHTTKEPSCKPR